MGIWHDVRFASRLLWKDRWFTAVAAATLALGIGVNTAVFTIVNGILLRGLPFDDPDRIVALGMTDARGRPMGVSLPDLNDWQTSAPQFSAMSLMLGAPVNLTEDGPVPEQYNGVYVTQPFFGLLRQRPAMGRDFRPDENQPGAPPTAIISHTLWQNRYNGAPDILGRVIKANTLPATVIGVMPPGMRFPFNVDVWLPYAQLPAESHTERRDVRNGQGLARLATGVSLAQARAAIETIDRQLAQTYPNARKDLRPVVVSFNDRITGPQLKLILFALTGAVAFVLLIACANVANLLLARSSGRAREVAVRASLGASRLRIVRQLLIESICLSCIGGVMGLGLAYAGVRIFDAVLSAPELGKPYWMTFTMDRMVFAYLAGICIATGVAFGLAPALHASRADVHDLLKEAGGRSAGGRRARRWTGALIVVELVLTLVLLAGAGYQIRSFLALYRSDLGAETSQVLTMRMFLPLTKYPRPDARAAVVQRLEERLHGINAIAAFTLTTNPPMFGGLLRQLAMAGKPDVTDRRPEVTMVGITAGYFETLGLRPLRGRSFEDIDGTPGHEAGIVNQRFATMHFAGEDPLGRQVTLYDAVPSAQPSEPRTLTIVGIVPSIRQRMLDADFDPVIYLPYRADPQRFLTLMVRGRGDAAALTTLVREQARAVEPDVPVFGIATLDALLAQSRWPFRVFGSMFALFAGIALVLSAVGLYAVTAYSVTQRTAEIGIRMALGAEPLHVIWLVLRRALMHLAIGLPLGIGGAFAAGRIMRSTMVPASGDTVTILSLALLLLVVSIGASFVPARRATRLDPAAALRHE